MECITLLILNVEEKADADRRAIQSQKMRSAHATALHFFSMLQALATRRARINVHK
jgi:hypothetical protein